MILFSFCISVFTLLCLWNEYLFSVFYAGLLLTMPLISVSSLFRQDFLLSFAAGSRVLCFVLFYVMKDVGAVVMVLRLSFFLGFII